MQKQPIFLMHFYTLSIWRQNAIDEQAVSQCQQNVFLTYNQVISWGYWKSSNLLAHPDWANDQTS